MAGIWVFSEHAATAKELMALANELAGQSGKTVSAVALNEDLAKELTTLGASKAIVLKNACTWPEAYAQAAADVLKAEGAEVVLVGGTATGKTVAPVMAQLMDAGLATDAAKVCLDGSDVVVERFVYGGLAVSTEAMTMPAFVTIPPRSYDAPAADKSGEVVVKDVEVATSATVAELKPIVREGADISAADKAVSVGRGVQAQEDVAKLIQPLADALGAEVSCSRPIAEDAKWFPIERYVGISGQKFKGSLYLACGISGQVQHISGIRDAKFIVAVNNSENAPIFANADYGIVGDLYEVLPLLTEAVKNAK